MEIRKLIVGVAAAWCFATAWAGAETDQLFAEMAAYKCPPVPVLPSAPSKSIVLINEATKERLEYASLSAALTAVKDLAHPITIVFAKDYSLQDGDATAFKNSSSKVTRLTLTSTYTNGTTMAEVRSTVTGNDKRLDCSRPTHYHHVTFTGHADLCGMGQELILGEGIVMTGSTQNFYAFGGQAGNSGTVTARSNQKLIVLSGTYMILFGASNHTSYNGAFRMGIGGQVTVTDYLCLVGQDPSQKGFVAIDGNLTANYIKDYYGSSSGSKSVECVIRGETRTKYYKTINLNLDLMIEGRLVVTNDAKVTVDSKLCSTDFLGAGLVTVASNGTLEVNSPNYPHTFQVANVTVKSGATIRSNNADYFIVDKDLVLEEDAKIERLASGKDNPEVNGNVTVNGNAYMTLSGGTDDSKRPLYLPNMGITGEGRLWLSVADATIGDLSGKVIVDLSSAALATNLLDHCGLVGGALGISGNDLVVTDSPGASYMLEENQQTVTVAELFAGLGVGLDAAEVTGLATASDKLDVSTVAPWTVSRKGDAAFTNEVVTVNVSGRMMTLKISAVAYAPKAVWIEDRIKDTGSLWAMSHVSGEVTWYRSADGETEWQPVTRRMVMIVAGEELYNVSSDCSKLNPSLDNGPLAYYKFVLKTGEGSYESAPYQVPYGFQLLNGGFEDYLLPDNANFYDDGYSYDGLCNPFLVNCDYTWEKIKPYFQSGRAYTNAPALKWKTSAPDGAIELWNASPDKYSVKEKKTYADCVKSKISYSPYTVDGEQIAEINCNYNGSLYQDVLSLPNTKARWGFSQRGRGYEGLSVVDKMRVAIASAQQAQQLFDYCASRNDLTYQDALKTVMTNPKAYVANGGPDMTGIYVSDTKSADAKSWKTYSGTYDVPAGQYLTRMFFVSDAAEDTHGNLIDAVSYVGDSAFVDVIGIIFGTTPHSSSVKGWRLDTKAILTAVRPYLILDADGHYSATNAVPDDSAWVARYEAGGKVLTLRNLALCDYTTYTFGTANGTVEGRGAVICPSNMVSRLVLDGENTITYGGGDAGAALVLAGFSDGFVKTGDTANGLVVSGTGSLTITQTNGGSDGRFNQAYGLTWDGAVVQSNGTLRVVETNFASEDAANNREMCVQATSFAANGGLTDLNLGVDVKLKADAPLGVKTTYAGQDPAASGVTGGHVIAQRTAAVSGANGAGLINFNSATGQYLWSTNANVIYSGTNALTEAKLAKKNFVEIAPCWQVVFSNGTTQVTAIGVLDGKTVVAPAAPSPASGKVFTGWYADSACLTAWDSAAPVTSNSVVYAGWRGTTDIVWCWHTTRSATAPYAKYSTLSAAAANGEIDDGDTLEFHSNTVESAATILRNDLQICAEPSQTWTAAFNFNDDSFTGIRFGANQKTVTFGRAETDGLLILTNQIENCRVVSAGNTYKSEYNTSNTVVLVDGVLLTGGSVLNQGGAVYVNHGCFFEMHGGTIAGNRTTNKDGKGTSESGGAAVYVEGTATIDGGVISNNTAKYFGGALYVDGTAKIGSGATIVGNAAGTDGSLVYLNRLNAENKGGVLHLSGNPTLEGEVYLDSYSYKANKLQTATGGPILVKDGALTWSQPLKVKLGDENGHIFAGRDIVIGADDAEGRVLRSDLPKFDIFYSLTPDEQDLRAKFTASNVGSGKPVIELAVVWLYPVGPNNELIPIDSDWIGEKGGADKIVNYPTASNWVFSVGENGVTNWYSYVMGLDPTNINSCIYLDIEPNAAVVADPTLIARGAEVIPLPVGTLTNVLFQLSKSATPTGTYEQVSETIDGRFPQTNADDKYYQVNTILRFRND